MSEKTNQELIEENKRLKLDVETYLKGYENILQEKLLLEEDYKSFKLAIAQQKKDLKKFNPGKSTVFNAQMDNFKYKSEIDEYLTTIFDLQTKLSEKEEEIRILSEKNKTLENQVQNLKHSSQNLNDEKIEEKKGNIDKKNSDEKNSILNMDDLYKNTIIAQTNKVVEQRVKKSLNINIKKNEEELEKKKKEEEEKKDKKNLKN